MLNLYWLIQTGTLDLLLVIWVLFASSCIILSAMRQAQCEPEVPECADTPKENLFIKFCRDCALVFSILFLQTLSWLLEGVLVLLNLIDGESND